MNAPLKIRTRNHYKIQLFHFWVYIQKMILNRDAEETTVLPCSMQHYSLSRQDKETIKVSCQCMHGKKMSYICVCVCVCVCVYSYNRILFSLTKKETIPFALTWKSVLKDIMLSQVSETQKDQYCVISFMCGM